MSSILAFIITISDWNTSDKKLWDPCPPWYCLYFLLFWRSRASNLGPTKWTSTWTSGHVGGQVVCTMSLIRRTSGNFGLFRPLLCIAKSSNTILQSILNRDALYTSQMHQHWWWFTRTPKRYKFTDEMVSAWSSRASTLEWASLRDHSQLSTFAQ